MGYNRPGKRRTEKMKRTKKDRLRIARKHAAQAQAGESGGVMDKVKHAAQAVAGAVGSAVQSVKDAVTGKKE